ncbi:hypothetical protein TWF132_003982 [Orbilia oligospora]|nr:hypothetical protein TWF132_003982 [Orbilia oligospora]
MRSTKNGVAKVIKFGYSRGVGFNVMATEDVRIGASRETSINYPEIKAMKSFSMGVMKWKQLIYSTLLKMTDMTANGVGNNG